MEEDVPVSFDIVTPERHVFQAFNTLLEELL
jgi:hypothetical protein